MKLFVAVALVSMIVAAFAQAQGLGVIVVTDDSKVYAVDAASGSMKKISDTGCMSPAVDATNDILYCSDGAIQIFMLDINNGTYLNEFFCPGIAHNLMWDVEQSALVVLSSKLYSQPNPPYTVSCYDPSDVNQAWQELGSWGSASAINAAGLGVSVDTAHGYVTFLNNTNDPYSVESVDFGGPLSCSNGTAINDPVITQTPLQSTLVADFQVDSGSGLAYGVTVTRSGIESLVNIVSIDLANGAVTTYMAGVYKGLFESFVAGAFDQVDGVYYVLLHDPSHLVGVNVRTKTVATNVKVDFSFLTGSPVSMTAY